MSGRKPSPLLQAWLDSGLAAKTHGLSKTSTWWTWIGMRQRCGYSKHIAYKNYGGRGITVCERWQNSFENFLTDMGEKPEGMSLDRIDNDGNYEPANCRWATRQEQNINSRRGRLPSRDKDTGRFLAG